MSEVAVITGGTAGVGRAVAREFAEHGADVAVLARGVERLEATRRELESMGVRALAIPTDVADADAVERAAEQVTQELGPIDVWVNDAMTTVFAPFLEITPEEFRRATEVTYLGFVYGTMSALRRMKARDNGTIVQVGSALAYRSIPLQSPYCGAKHAIVGFTDSIRSELIHENSRVQLTVVHLPAMNTPQFSWCRTKLPRHPQPVPPIYQPEVGARAIYDAAHARRREVYVAWPTVKAIYGQEIAPGYADRYLAANAIDGQQTSEPVQNDRPDNLFNPVAGDWAAHGIFADRASNISPLTWLDLHRESVALGAAAILGFGLAMSKTRRKYLPPKR
jgi:NAD(P)-dependent dehydrogenase (short-subunit alcohol dehydrogenase family)